MFRNAAEELFGVRPRIEKRYHGEITKLLREKEAACSAQAADVGELETP